MKSVKSEALSKLIVLGERSLRHIWVHYLCPYHEECSHQGIGNVIPCPSSQPANDHEGVVHCHERLGGLLKYYDRQAA